MIQRLDRWRGILGRDCDGKPLRSGDPVVVVRTFSNPHLVGMHTRVVRRAQIESFVITDLECDTPGAFWGFRSDCLRIAKDRDASWEDIAAATGWTPRKVREHKADPVEITFEIPVEYAPTAEARIREALDSAIRQQAAELRRRMLGQSYPR